MTKTAKTITYAAGIFTAFWLIIAFLITSRLRRSPTGRRDIMRRNTRNIRF